MKWRALLTILFIFFGQHAAVFSQQCLVEYSFDFRFKDGIYLSYEEFKNNAPSVTNYKIVDRNGLWMEQVDKDLVVRRIEYTGREGEKVILRKKDIWGMSHDGQPYYFKNKHFYKILKVGSIMYLVIPLESLPTYRDLYEAPGGQIMTTSAIFDKPQYLIDFHTGKFYQYHPKNLEYLIWEDRELYEEYERLTCEKEKKYHLMEFLQEYNARHPIFFPAANDRPFNFRTATEVDLQ